MKNLTENPKYIRKKITPIISISKIVTIHYFEFNHLFQSDIESHDFWEFVYVDKGMVLSTTGGNAYVVSQGDYIFIKPNERHGISAYMETNPNVFIISFVCHSPAMHYFKNDKRILPASLKRYIANIISEARQTYELPFNEPHMLELLTRENELPGGQQLIKLYLELLLIQLYRHAIISEHTVHNDPILSDVVTENELTNRMIRYIQTNVYQAITPFDVCTVIGFSRSYLSTLFHHNSGFSIVEFINRVKINEAKNLIRKGINNFAEISDVLNYSNPQYFCRVFRRVTGMSPTEYKHSIQI